MRARIEWRFGDTTLVARVPTGVELEEAAPLLADAYADPRNAAMMGHDAAFDAHDVIEHYGQLAEAGGVAFLLYEGERLVGDADLRAIDRDAGHAEIAIMLRPIEGTQSRGLGTRFAVMVHAYAFRALGLATVYAAVLADNQPSQRLFVRIGHHPDDSPRARAHVDDESEKTYSIDRETFERLHAAALEAIVIDDASGVA